MHTRLALGFTIALGSALLAVPTAWADKAGSAAARDMRCPTMDTGRLESPATCSGGFCPINRRSV